MGIVSIILGVLGIILSWIPCLWPIVAIHVVIGLGLGIADLVVKKQAVAGGPPGDEQVRQARISVAVAGICLNVIAAILTITWNVFWGTNGFGAFN